MVDDLDVEVTWSSSSKFLLQACGWIIWN